MAHHVTLTPVRLREHSTSLRVDTLRIVGYRAVCSCGERSPVRARACDVTPWLRAHRRTAG